MDRNAYIAKICSRFGLRTHVPFRRVSIGDWRPSVACCHDNVTKWVAAHPDAKAVRGWVTLYGDGFSGMFLTAHSVVEQSDGELYDITPLEDEDHHQADRLGMLFIKHVGDERLFFAFKAGGHTINCPCDQISANP